MTDASGQAPRTLAARTQSQPHTQQLGDLEPFTCRPRCAQLCHGLSRAVTLGPWDTTGAWHTAVLSPCACVRKGIAGWRSLFRSYKVLGKRTPVPQTGRLRLRWGLTCGILVISKANAEKEGSQPTPAPMPPVRVTPVGGVPYRERTHKGTVCHSTLGCALQAPPCYCE